jgi:hypothetical protein
LEHRAVPGSACATDAAWAASPALTRDGLVQGQLYAREGCRSVVVNAAARRLAGFSACTTRAARVTIRRRTIRTTIAAGTANSAVQRGRRRGRGHGQPTIASTTANSACAADSSKAAAEAGPARVSDVLLSVAGRRIRSAVSHSLPAPYNW